MGTVPPIHPSYLMSLHYVSVVIHILSKKELFSFHPCTLNNRIRGRNLWSKIKQFEKKILLLVCSSWSFSCVSGSPLPSGYVCAFLSEAPGSNPNLAQHLQHILGTFRVCLNVLRLSGQRPPTFYYNFSKIPAAFLFEARGSNPIRVQHLQHILGYFSCTY